jgi:hypothetical protein
MDFDINNLSQVLGVIGAYFAILLVLSVSVETLLEPFSFFKGLRKTASPDDVLKSVKEWLPEGSDDAAKALAIQTFTEQAQVNVQKLDETVYQLRQSTEKVLVKMDENENLSAMHTELALRLATLREHYASTQKQRITWLRTLSAIIGIVIAFLLRIDTFEILGSLFSADTLSALASPLGHFGGMFLTGLAASAGSSFWHDMIGRVRNVKDTVKQAEQVIQQAKS